jgi:Neprosin
MKTKRMLTTASAVVVAAMCLGQTTPVNADTSSSTTTPEASAGVYGPKGSPGKDLADVPGDYGASFNYVDGSVIGIADGASVQIDQARPVIGPGFHSLVELSVESLDTHQIVEVGWTVDKGLNGDDLPHLFVFHWVDGTPTCYNACGFVQVSSSIHPGETVGVGDSQSYDIQHIGGNWWVGFAGILFGYFPDSLWNGTYTKAGLSQVFGEVATNGPGSCTMMGNGIFGTQPGSTTVSQFSLINPKVPVPALVPLVTDPPHWAQGNLSNTSFQLGGPGAC